MDCPWVATGGAFHEVIVVGLPHPAVGEGLAVLRVFVEEDFEQLLDGQWRHKQH
jgi:hypothetical protein